MNKLQEFLTTTDYTGEYLSALTYATDLFECSLPDYFYRETENVPANRIRLAAATLYDVEDQFDEKNAFYDEIAKDIKDALLDTSLEDDMFEEIMNCCGSLLAGYALTQTYGYEYTPAELKEIRLAYENLSEMDTDVLISKFPAKDYHDEDKLDCSAEFRNIRLQLQEEAIKAKKEFEESFNHTEEEEIVDDTKE